MLYWPRKADEFTIEIPNAAGYVPGEDDPALWLEVRGNVSLMDFPGGVEGWAVTPLYIAVSFVDWSVPDEAQDGEYNYTLRLGADGPVLSSGLLTIGDYAPERVIEYEKTTEYEQYGNE